MFNFTHNNYIKFGWNDGIFNRRETKEDKCWVKFGKCTKRPKDFRSECIRAARLIYESTDKKILIHLSGGIDSEIICRSFLGAKLPFDVCIWEFDHGHNKHDITYAIDFCKRYDIKPNFLKINLQEHIFNNQYPQYKYHIPLWSLNMRKYAIEKMYGYQLMGDGHLNFIYDPISVNSSMKNKYLFPMPFYVKYYKTTKQLEEKTYVLFSEAKHMSNLSFMEDHDKQGCDNFFMYTPELVLSYLKDNLAIDWFTYCDMKNLSNDRKYPILKKKPRIPIWVSKEEYIESVNSRTLSNLKHHIQYEHWPEMEIRPKYTGADLFAVILIEDHLEYLSKKYPYDSPGNEMIFITAYDFLKSLELKGV
jgi:hypothetical protein